MTLFRTDPSRHIILELSRTPKKVRLIETLPSQVRDIRWQDIQYTERVGNGEKTRLIDREFDRVFTPLMNGNGPYPLIKGLNLWLEDHYTPLTERAKKEIVMLIIAMVKRGEVNAEGQSVAKVIGKFEDMATALQAVPAGTELIDTETLGNFSIPALTQIYNTLVGPEKAVKGYSDKTKALAAVTRAITEYKVETPEKDRELAKAEKAEAKAAKEAEKAEAKAAKEAEKAAKEAEKAEAKAAKEAEKAEAKARREAAKAAGTSTHTKISDDLVVHMLVDKNPKRETSDAGKRFAFYQEGMTVKQALDAGILRADLSWDTRHGFIELRAAA